MSHAGLKIVMVTMALVSILANGYDPNPSQDFCVAVDNLESAVLVNGMFCKNPELVTAEDFSFTGLLTQRNTSNFLGTSLTFATVQQVPGLNTMGVSIVHLDFAPFGVNPPHHHPRASEILLVLEGFLYVGFVTSNPEHRLFTKILGKGDTFVFPVGLVHFQRNLGDTHAVAIASFGSQNPGVVTLANTVFGSEPEIFDPILTTAFQLDEQVINHLQAKTWQGTGFNDQVQAY